MAKLVKFTEDKGTRKMLKVIKDMDDKFVRGPVGRSWWMGYGYIGLKIRGEHLFVSDIWIEQRYRNDGEGGRMLRSLLKVADKHNQPMCTLAQPFDERTANRRSTKELRDWYARYGFIEGTGGLMKRLPRTRHLKWNGEVSRR